MKNHLLRILTLTLAITLIQATKSRAGSAWQIEYQGDSDASEPTAFRESVSTLTNSDLFPDSFFNAEQLDDWFVYAGSPPIFGLQGRIQGLNAGTDYGTWIYGYIEAP